MSNNVFILGILFLFILTSCNSGIPQQKQAGTHPIFTTVPDTPTAMITLSPKPFNTPSPFITNTPTKMWQALGITATQIIKGARNDLTQMLDQLYSITACSINLLDQRTGELAKPEKPEFIDVEIQPDSEKWQISESADNLDKSRQAFIACDPDFCQDKLYVREHRTEKVFEINWSSRLPWRPIQKITWIDNDVLVFSQSSSPKVTQVVAIDFEKRDYIYHSIVYYDCPLSTPTP